MKLIPLKFAAVALAGLLAASSGAQAGGGDFNAFPNLHSNSEPSYDYEEYCEEHPYTDRCEDYRREQYRERRHEKRVYRKKAYDNHCRALIRAVGKRNVVRGFARNSAVFAWRRESRAVHGAQYANWNNADNAHISCSRTGILFSCVAKATPCR